MPFYKCHAAESDVLANRKPPFLVKNNQAEKASWAFQ
jgi:hypothetical protein